MCVVTFNKNDYIYLDFTTKRDAHIRPVASGNFLNEFTVSLL